MNQNEKWYPKPKDSNDLSFGYKVDDDGNAILSEEYLLKLLERFYDAGMHDAEEKTK